MSEFCAGCAHYTEFTEFLGSCHFQFPPWAKSLVQYNVEDGHNVSPGDTCSFFKNNRPLTERLRVDIDSTGEGFKVKLSLDGETFAQDWFDIPTSRN